MPEYNLSRKKKQFDIVILMGGNYIKSFKNSK